MKYKKREKVNTVFRGKKTNLREPTILEGDTVYYHGCSFDLSAGGVDQYTCFLSFGCFGSRKRIRRTLLRDPGRNRTFIQSQKMSM